MTAVYLVYTFWKNSKRVQIHGYFAYFHLAVTWYGETNKGTTLMVVCHNPAMHDDVLFSNVGFVECAPGLDP